MSSGLAVVEWSCQGWGTGDGGQETGDRRRGTGDGVNLLTSLICLFFFLHFIHLAGYFIQSDIQITHIEGTVDDQGSEVQSSTIFR